MNKQIRKDIPETIAIENWYIDFKYLIIGEKIKHLNGDEEMEKFDDKYFANLIMCGEGNNEFFTMDSVKKIIDFQFKKTYKLFNTIFWFYIILYAIPYCITLVLDDHELNSKLILFCVLPQTILLSIEILQMYQQGFEYFLGWNIIDLLQILVFFTMFYIDFSNFDSEAPIV